MRDDQVKVIKYNHLIADLVNHFRLYDLNDREPPPADCGVWFADTHG